MSRHLEVVTHSILFPAYQWNTHPSTRELSEEQGLMPPLYAGTIPALKAVVPSVSPPDPELAEAIYDRLDLRRKDYSGNVSRLMAAIDEALYARFRGEEVRNAVGQAMILAVDKQKPFILSGLADTPRRQRERPVRRAPRRR